MIYGKHENYAAGISIIQCKLSNLGSLDGPFDWQKLKVGVSIISINLVFLLNKGREAGSLTTTAHANYCWPILPNRGITPEQPEETHDFPEGEH